MLLPGVGRDLGNREALAGHERSIRAATGPSAAGCLSMRSALATLVATVVLLLPAAASASTAQVEVEQSYGTYYYVAYDAAPGEVNDLTASGDEHGIVLTDPGAEIMPGDGCTSTGAPSVACTHEYGLSYVEADLGDGEDHFTTTGPTFDVDGGPGNDVIDGGQSGGELRGGD